MRIFILMLFTFNIDQILLMNNFILKNINFRICKQSSFFYRQNSFVQYLFFGDILLERLQVSPCEASVLIVFIY